jgi:hypothetical protein
MSNPRVQLPVSRTRFPSAEIEAGLGSCRDRDETRRAVDGEHGHVGGLVGRRDEPYAGAQEAAFSRFARQAGATAVSSVGR